MNRVCEAVRGLAVGLAGLLAATKICDPDTMQYLAGGRYTLAHGLETACVFGYASEQCQIVYPQWLFHVLTYLVYTLGSWNGLVAAQVAMALAVFAVIARRHARAGIHPLSSAALLVAAAMVARERFMFRADFFALIPAVLFYVSLARLFESGELRRRDLLAAGGVVVLWVNTHGSFPVALAILGAFVVDASIRRDVPRSRVFAAVGTIAVASVLNPYGFVSFLQPFRFLMGGSASAPQAEFLSPFAPADLEHVSVVAYKVLLAGAIVLLVAAHRTVRVRDALILAALGALSATGIRYIALFAVFCALLLPVQLETVRAWIAARLPSASRDRLSRGIEVAAAAALALSIAGIAQASVTNGIYRYDAISRRAGFGLSDLAYPVGAAEFVDRSRISGAMFNDYSIGTYLNFRLFPARRTFIDGHTYTPESLQAYRQVMAMATPYAGVVDRFGINYFILSHKVGETRDLIAKLYHDEQWALVYLDEIAVVFVKRVPENDALIARFRPDLRSFGKDPLPPLVDIVTPEDFYLGHTDRGLALGTLGLAEAAAFELEAAARENPESFVTLTALALTLEQNGDAARALDACRRAVRARPGYAPARFWLGVFYLRRKNVELGIEQLEAALRINPKMPLAHFNLGAAYENRGDKVRAAGHYRAELAINPAHRPAQTALRRVE